MAENFAIHIYHLSAVLIEGFSFLLQDLIDIGYSFQDEKTDIIICCKLISFYRSWQEVSLKTNIQATFKRRKTNIQ